MAARYAIDPMCGMQVEKANAPAHLVHDGVDVWFCSDRCRERFDTEPARFASKQRQPEPIADHPVDPVCGMTVDPESAAAHRTYDGRDFWFCGDGCAAAFDADPACYATHPASAHTHHHDDH